MTPDKWEKFEPLLKAHEDWAGVQRVSLDIFDAPQYGNRCQEYRLWYLTGGIMNERKFVYNLRNLWGKFPNPLSRKWK